MPFLWTRMILKSWKIYLSIALSVSCLQTLGYSCMCKSIIILKFLFIVIHMFLFECKHLQFDAKLFAVFIAALSIIIINNVLDVQGWAIMCFSMYYLNTPMGIICPLVNTLCSSLWPLQTALILSPPHHQWCMGMYKTFIKFYSWYLIWKRQTYNCF